jgi:two-component system sensor histidine kinase AlgZ
LRLDDRLVVSWQVNVDTSSVTIPLLTLQPLLENAIYHGIQPLPQGGTVTVTVSESDGMLELIITNPVAHEDHSYERGNKMALDNTRRRLEAVYGKSASVTTHQDQETFTTRVKYPLSEDT